MIYRIVFLSVMLFCPSTPGWAKEHFPFLGEVSTDKVSVRAGQNVNFERVDILSQGTDVIVHEEQYGWYKIQLPSTAKGYVRIDYLVLENDAVGRIAGNRVNVRAGRGVNFSALGQLEKETYVRLVNKMDDWFQIVPLEGLYGWVSKEFIRFKSEEIPALESLGLAPITALSVVEATHKISDHVPLSSSPVSVVGTIEAIAPLESLNNASYQLTTEDGKIYYLQILPAVINNFARDHVRVEGGLVSGVTTLPYPVISVRKFQLIL